MKEKKLYAVKEVCERFSITRKTLFYYDRTGLLKPSVRLGKQECKYYDGDALKKLESILKFRRAGLSMEELSQVIDLKDHDQIRGILLKVKERLNLEEKQKQEEMRNLDLLIRLPHH